MAALPDFVNPVREPSKPSASELLAAIYKGKDELNRVNDKIKKGRVVERAQSTPVDDLLGPL